MASETELRFAGVIYLGMMGNERLTGGSTRARQGRGLV
jgi:hypothetical protein